MYVYWKSLILLGFMLWTLLCVTDSLQQKYPSNDDWMSDISIEEKAVQNTATKENDQLFIEERDLFKKSTDLSWDLLFWNILAFATTLSLCVILRKITFKVFEYFWKYNAAVKDDASIELNADQKGSNSKIPIFVPNRPVAVLRFAEEVDSSSKNLLSNKSVPNISSHRNLYAENFEKHMEQQCAKLREEMLSVQASSLKEHAMLSKKLEAINKEKKELAKQLAIANKENRAARHQLDELLTEKTMLLKRLENATKEFRVNTKAKKQTLARLEEAHAKIDKLKLQLECVLRDKELIEERAKIMADECQRNRQPDVSSIDTFDLLEEDPPTRENLNIHDSYYFNETKTENEENISTYKSDKSILTNPISRASIDMKMIQMKIEKLEKNLEKFKPRLEANKNDSPRECSTPLLSDIKSTENVENQQMSHYKEIFTRKSGFKCDTETDTEKSSTMSICNKPNCSLEHVDCNKLKCLLPDGTNKIHVHKSTSEQPKTTKTNDSFRSLPTGKQCDILKQFIKNRQSSVNATLSLTSHEDDMSSTPNFSIGNSDTSRSTSILDQDSSNEEWNATTKRGIVSKSPAFQEFLQKLDYPQKSSEGILSPLTRDGLVY